LSVQSASLWQASRVVQPSGAQYWPVPQALSFKTRVQKPAKHWSSVQATPSSQSLCLQHCPHSPAQHTGSLPPHFPGFWQMPSLSQLSTVQGLPSSQSLAS
jgi:hypothetical protein